MKATKQTLGIIVSVFVVQMLSINVLGSVSTSFYTLAHPLIQSEPWTIILNVYSHAGFNHLFGNAVALIVLGLIVERVTTPLRFHLFFATTGIIAGLSQVTLWLLVGSQTVSVLGASGAIFALMGYAVIGNNLTDTFIDILDLGKAGTILLFIALAVFITMATASPGIALVAHGTGFLLGAFAGHFRLLHQNDS